MSGAAAFDTFDMQKNLLAGEGVEVLWTREGWQVDRKRYGWKHTMQDAEKFRALFEELRI